MLTDFPGWVTNQDAHDLPHGTAVKQVNVVATRPGELRVRYGTRVLKFDPPPDPPAHR